MNRATESISAAVDAGRSFFTAGDGEWIEGDFLFPICLAAAPAT